MPASYPAPAATGAPTGSAWADLLGRRIAARATLVGGLAVAPDGRIALAAGANVSVLHAMAAATPAAGATTSLRDVLDDSAREARSMRPALVGHVPVAHCASGARTPAWVPLPDAATLVLPRPLRCLAPRSVDGGLAVLAPGDEWRPVPGGLQADAADDARVAADDEICTAFLRVCATGLDGSVILDADNLAKCDQYLVRGCKHGTFIHRWHGAGKPLGAKRKLTSFWASAVETDCSGTSAKLAIGGPFGELVVLNISWVIVADDEMGDAGLNVQVMWQAPDGLFFGPVNSLSFALHQPHSGFAYIAVAVGNCVAVVRVLDTLPGAATPTKARRTAVRFQGNAHSQLTSSVNWLLDGTVLSTSTDGGIARWRMHWAEEQQPCVLVETVQRKSNDLTAVMGARRSGNGLMVVALSSRPKNAGEIGEPAVHVKRKYGSAARSSLLSILAYPGLDGEKEDSHVRICLESAIDKLLTAAMHFDDIVSLWDVQLWLLSKKSRLLPAGVVLRKKLASIISSANNEAIPAVQNRLRKVALCVVILLTKVQDMSVEKSGQMHGLQIQLRTLILCCSYTKALQNMIPGDVPNVPSQLSSEQREMAEAMYTFVHTNIHLVGDGIREAMAKISSVLTPVFKTPSTRVLSVCQVCDPGLQLPLAADPDDLENFFCPSGDCFARCVLSALPCTDAVPLVCTGCQSRARCTGVDPYDEESLESGATEVLVCPLCSSPFLPSPWN